MHPLDNAIVAALAVMSVVTCLTIVCLLAAEVSVIWRTSSRVLVWMLAVLSGAMAVPCLYYLAYEDHPLMPHARAMLVLMLLCHVVASTCCANIIWRSWLVFPAMKTRDLRMWSCPAMAKRSAV